MTWSAAYRRRRNANARELASDCPTPRKQPYTSRSAAETALGQAWRRPYRRGGKLPVRTYKCPCGKWHMTAQPLREKAPTT